MQKSVTRKHNRKPNALRDIKISINPFGYAAGSVLFELGNTKVLCSVSLQQGVPHFLKGTKAGWLTAGYAMLPTATQTRTVRASSLSKPNGRSIEISRLIGRALRCTVDLKKLGERTIYIDCDVLQADGGTRTTCITGAYLALKIAVKNLLESGVLKENILVDGVAAVSVGFVGSTALLDVDYQEDSTVDADFNFVLTQSGNIVELQGSAENKSVNWQTFEQGRALAQKGITQLFATFEKYKEYFELLEKGTFVSPLFSLKNRQNSA